jgi:hypothetical protein
VLEHLDPEAAAGQVPGEGAARAVAAVEEAGGFAAQLSDIEEVSAFHGDNYEVLVHRNFVKDRSVMFELVDKLELVATSSDDSVLAALEHARTYQAKRRDFIPLPHPVDGDDAVSGIAFASQNWRRAVTDRRHLGMVARRHFEAMVFTYLARNCAPAASRCSAPGSTPTGAPTCSPDKSASRCWRGSAPRSACPPPPPDSSSGCGTRTWTRPPNWTLAMRTTPTW